MSKISSVISIQEELLFRQLEKITTTREAAILAAFTSQIGDRAAQLHRCGREPNPGVLKRIQSLALSSAPAPIL